MPEQLKLSVLRTDDLLALKLQFDAVNVYPPQPGQAGKIEGTANSRLTVHLQPQHITEQAFHQASQDHQFPVPSDEALVDPGSVASRLAGRSRLVFDVPAGEIIPMTLEGVLDALGRLTLRVSAVNRYEPPGCFNPTRFFVRPPAVTRPVAGETAIELPYRLMLSPDETARWQHASLPVKQGDWVELWHTRLGSTSTDGDPSVRAIWSPDFNADTIQPDANVPFRTSLTGNDRNQLVHLTANYRLPGYLPKPVDTEQFMLSTLGAWLKVDGNWELPTTDLDLTMVHWRHEASMGRDQFVRVVDLGHLLPYGHRAVKVTISERKFFYREDATTPGHIAYLYQREFIIVRELERNYSNRDMPFRTVGFKTRITPNLVDSANSTAGHNGAFWPRIDTGGGATDFHFHLWGLDWEGNRIDWTTPLVFVSVAVDDGTEINGVINHYNATTGARRDHGLGGQQVAFAPADKLDDTSFEVAVFRPKAIAMSGGSAPFFRPAMNDADIDVPAVKQLLGNGVLSTVELEDSFVSASGNSMGNKGDVFLRIANATPLKFATEKAGGMVAPNIDISGLSRSIGPIGGDAQKMVGGEFKPEDIFGNDIELLGGIKLWEIVLDMVFDAVGTTAGKIPGLTSERIGNLIRTRYTWEIGTGEMVQNHDIFTPGANSTFKLEATVDAPLDGTTPTFITEGELTDFSTTLLPIEGLQLVEINFNALRFSSTPGGKTDVNVDLGEIKFTGILEFVNELQSSIPLDGFSAGPIIDVGGSGVNAGFTFGIPTIAVGVMTIQNINLSAAVFLPFDESPLNFHFAFCERQQPFILTVTLFGGGGFFSIDVGTKGVVMIEAALEFGASAAINLGVASGEATIMAGFYFQMAGSDFQLTGYVRAYGSLSVLGIISVSLEFNLSLTYATKNAGTSYDGHLWGQASLTVKIEILFFSTSVSVSMERTFAGSDPKFLDVLTPSDWQAYTGAFANYA